MPKLSNAQSEQKDLNSTFDVLIQEKKKRFRESLRKLLIASGISQKELAERTELSPSLITNYVRGTSFPSCDSIYKMAYALSVSESVLLGADYENKELNELLLDPVMAEIFNNCLFLSDQGRDVMLKASQRLVQDDRFLNREGKLAKSFPHKAVKNTNN